MKTVEISTLSISVKVHHQERVRPEDRDHSEAQTSQNNCDNSIPLY